MYFVHHGVAIQPSVSRAGNTFVARVSILEEDGEMTSLGELGQFADRESALAFAVRCGTAFAENEPLPELPQSPGAISRPLASAHGRVATPGGRNDAKKSRLVVL
ncbi:hypothetical protein [Paraburkholderia azotifigens]|uniref:hypothetical protein n=1 Tax=Paraburkholderia azotifigens TaxID=2057004 RepID=UPI001F003976|nr:hypothetical protein [Paraburkholderia azotifigens]